MKECLYLIITKAKQRYGDDPPVYYCQRSLQDNTDEADYVKWYDSFSACIEGYIEMRRTGKI